MSTKPWGSPHVVFLLVWLLWYATVIWSFTVVLENPLAALSTLLAFFVYELLALALHWRNTLSGSVTWVVRQLSKHKEPFKGWNWLVDIVAAPVALLVGLTCYSLAPNIAGAALGVSLGVPVLIMLHQHWLRPDVHG